MASREKGFFSFRKHEGHMFFIYDHKKKKEEDDPKDAILYFYPRSVKTDDQIALVGGIIGITDFCLEFLPQEMPQIVKLSAHNFALLQDGDYIIGLAGSIDIPTNFLLAHMQFLWSTFVFYQGSITALRQRQPEEQFLRKLNMVWDIYLPLCQSQGDLLGQAFQTIPYIRLHRSQGSLFLHASHILQRSLRQKGVLAGALFSKNKVLCTQVSNVLTRKLLLLMMQTQFPSVEVNPNLELPGGVHLIYIYLTQEEYRSLNHRRKKRYSSSLQSSVEETDMTKNSMSSDLKKSVFSDSAISSGGEQFTSHSANISAEHNSTTNSNCNNDSGHRNESLTHFQKSFLSSTSEVDSETFTDAVSRSNSKAEVEVQENYGVSCQEWGKRTEMEPKSHIGAFNEHCDNTEGSEKGGFPVESHTRSLNICDSGKFEKDSKEDKGNDSSISVSSGSNSSIDNPKQEQLNPNKHSNESLSPNEGKRNSSPDDNSGNSSPVNNDRNSPDDKNEKLSSNDDSNKLSQNDESGKYSSNETNDIIPSVDDSGHISSNKISANLSSADEERSDEIHNKDMKDSDVKDFLPESQLTETTVSKECQKGNTKEINRKLDLPILNNHVHFPSREVGSNLKESPNSDDSSPGVVQSNDLVKSEVSQKSSSSNVIISKVKNCSFQRYVSLEGSYNHNHNVSVSGDDLSIHSSCEVRKEDDQGTSRKSSVNSLANSDVTSSKDRLVFENLDSENSDFALVSPDSELHPLFQGSSIPVGLSSLKEADGEDGNYGSFHSCQEGDGGLTVRLVNERKNSSDDKSSKWTSQQNNLSKMNLYIQGHSDTLLVLLIEKEVTCSKSYIHTLWKSCLSHLGELDFEVKNVERHSKDETENIGALYQYMKYDSFSQSLSGSAILPVTSLANEMVDSCVRMHKDFIFMPDLVDATYRSHTACSFGRRSLNSETFFQLGLPSRGGVNPGEKTFLLEQTAEKCLVDDHKISLL